MRSGREKEEKFGRVIGGEIDDRRQKEEEEEEEECIGVDIHDDYPDGWDNNK